MTELAIPHQSHGSNPITLDCCFNGQLRLHYGNKPLNSHDDAIAIELSPDGSATVLELAFDGYVLQATGDLSFTTTTTGTLTATLYEPTSDFLTVELSAAKAGKVDTGKLYVKAKPHGGLPAGG